MFQLAQWVKDYIKRADVIIEKYSNGEKDNVTGKPVSKDTKDAAEIGKKGFKAAENIKGRQNDGQEHFKPIENGDK